MNYQLSLFGFQRPRAKVPLSAARIEEVKALIAAGNGKSAVEKLRDIRYDLEKFERSIKVGAPTKA